VFGSQHGACRDDAGGHHPAQVGGSGLLAERPAAAALGASTSGSGPPRPSRSAPQMPAAQPPVQLAARIHQRPHRRGDAEGVEDVFQSFVLDEPTQVGLFVPWAEESTAVRWFCRA